MEILSTNVYVGPNEWALFPVIRHRIDLGVLESWPSGRLGAGFQQALVEALPGLHAHTCSYGEPGGFVRRLTEDEGTWLGHVWEHVAIQLQVQAGVDVSFGKTRSAGEAGVYDMVYSYEQRDVGLEAGDLGRRLIRSLLPPEIEVGVEREDDFDWDVERDDFIRFVQRRSLGPSTNSIVQAARERDIPWLRLNAYSLVQFGHGSLQRRIQATITSETRHIAVAIASDKEETHDLLRDLGLPVPKQRLVTSARDAVRAAEHIGWPVVLKPLDANHGRGVSINLVGRDEIPAAFDHALASATGQSVIVESYVTGFDHRMLVVNGSLIAVAKRVPGHVVGDGSSTIEELVEEVNADSRRGVGHEKVLTRIDFDRQADEAMEANGLNRESILPEGEILYLRNTANLSTGGTAIDLTDVVHPDNRLMAERAVQAVGLDVGGVDFLTDDITQSWKDVGGAIVEVNAAPGFRMHVAPSEGSPRDVAGPVMDMLFPPGTPNRIPIAAITGTNGKTTTSRMVGHIQKGTGQIIGLTSTDGVYIDGNLTVKGDMTGPTAARMVLRDPSVTMAVMETARGGLLRAGMGYSRCDVGAVLNVTADHLGLRGIDTVEQLAAIKRIVVETATNTAVLNADDRLCLEMASHTTSEHLCYVTMDPGHELVRQHIQQGGRAVVLEQGINGEMITIYDKGAHIPLLWTHLIPATMEGRARHNVQNACFAVAITYALGTSLEDIRTGLRTFDTTFFQAPGRMNMYTELPFRVLLDYAHNPAAVRALCDTVSRFDVAGERIAVLAAPGDRRDEDIIDIATTAAGHFDRFVLKPDDHRRGRDDDEVCRIMADALRATGVADNRIEIVLDEQRAVAESLASAVPGDMLVIFGDDVTRTWKQIVKYEYGDVAPSPTLPPSTVTLSPDDAADDELRLDPSSYVIDERGVTLASLQED